MRLGSQLLKKKNAPNQGVSVYIPRSPVNAYKSSQRETQPPPPRSLLPGERASPAEQRLEELHGGWVILTGLKQDPPAPSWVKTKVTRHS